MYDMFCGLLFVVCCLLFVVCCLWFVVCCLLFVVCCCSLFVVRCLLFGCLFGVLGWKVAVLGVPLEAWDADSGFFLVSVWCPGEECLALLRGVFFDTLGTSKTASLCSARPMLPNRLPPSVLAVRRDLRVFTYQKPSKNTQITTDSKHGQG